MVLVAAVADNGVIGRDGRLPWHLPEDLAHFRRLTTGHVVLMGRRTYESVGRPLPRRTNIVLTRRADWSPPGVLTAPDLESAVRIAGDHPGDLMVIGGAEVYAAAMPFADAQVLTRVHQHPPGGVRYPPYDPDAWDERRRDRHDGFDVVWLERRDGARPA